MNTEVITEFDDTSRIYEELERSDKISQSKLTKYEYAKIIGLSAQQIQSGRKPQIKIPPNVSSNPIDIAEYELKQKKTPFIIKRKMPNNTYEYWTLDQLDL